MAIGAILGGVLQSALAATNSVSKFKQFQQEFRQPGQDLQSGNLAQAQTDFVTLEKNSPFLQAAASASGSTTGAGTGTSSATSGSPIAQAFSQLSKDLQAGNLSAAQGDFSTIQQDFQNAQLQSQGQGGGHHHHHFASSSSQSSPLAQLFSQLGQALQTGNLSGPQQAYSALQQDFQRFTSGTGATGGSVNATA